MTVRSLAQTVPEAPRSLRSDVALGMTAAASAGRLALQVCSRCQAAQYPPREACHRCLSDSLVWTQQSGAGELLSSTVLHHSHDPCFSTRLPWTIGMIKLDCGPTVITHLPADAPAPPARVWVSARLDRRGMPVLLASARMDGADSSNDERLRDLTGDPEARADDAARERPEGEGNRP